MRLKLRTFALLSVVLVLGLPAVARASGASVIRDCAQDGQLNQNYSQKDLRQALSQLPSDIDEYTDCRAVIRAALTGGSGSTTPPPPGGIATPSGAIAASPADVNALANLTGKGKRPAVSIDGKPVLAGNAGLSGVLGGLQGSNGMPGPLIAALAALLLLATVTAYLVAREKFGLVRRAALRLFGR